MDIMLVLGLCSALKLPEFDLTRHAKLECASHFLI